MRHVSSLPADYAALNILHCLSLPAVSRCSTSLFFWTAIWRTAKCDLNINVEFSQTDLKVTRSEFVKLDCRWCFDNCSEVAGVTFRWSLLISGSVSSDLSRTATDCAYNATSVWFFADSVHVCCCQCYNGCHFYVFEHSAIVCKNLDISRRVDKIPDALEIKTFFFWKICVLRMWSSGIAVHARRSVRIWLCVCAGERNYSVLEKLWYSDVILGECGKCFCFSKKKIGSVYAGERITGTPACHEWCRR
jgi:hypothetical protein